MVCGSWMLGQQQRRRHIRTKAPELPGAEARILERKNVEGFRAIQQRRRALDKSREAPIKRYAPLRKALACEVCVSGARAFFRGPSQRYALPIILGHEFTGEVVDTSAEVEGYEIDDRVTVAPLVPYMRCQACLQGKDNLCEESKDRAPVLIDRSLG